jgi:hypothetical protein
MDSWVPSCVKAMKINNVLWYLIVPFRVRVIF